MKQKKFVAKRAAKRLCIKAAQAETIDWICPIVEWLEKSDFYVQQQQQHKNSIEFISLIF